jgi:uncharacterized protein DUF6519
MKADISRQTFNRLKRFSSVVMQQGRVQLDSDWNEQAQIVTYSQRRLAADVFGPHAGPHNMLGFAIEPLNPAITPEGKSDFVITPGRYYVDGILCELDSTLIPVTLETTNNKNEVRVGTWTVDGVLLKKGQYVLLTDWSPNTTVAATSARIVDIDYVKQLVTLTDITAWVNGSGSPSRKPRKPFMQRLTTFLQQPDASFSALPQGTFQVYLDVWERAVTWLEDDTIREVALSGADTAARAKVVWQVKVLPVEGDRCMLPQVIADKVWPPNRGLLRAQASAHALTDPCAIAPGASRYRGPENQLYRVEVHTGSFDASGNESVATFKWSRENGAVAFVILSGGGTNTLKLENLGRDDRFGLAEGDWVEVEDDSSVLQNRVVPLLQVEKIDRSSSTIILAGNPAADIGNDPANQPRIRRWDHKASGGITLGPDNAVQITAAALKGEWIELEEGVQIQFLDVANSAFQAGDYWLIPARVASGNVIWPTETIPINQNTSLTQAIALPPDGVTHHYAPLAVIQVDINGVNLLNECRLEFAAPAAVELVTPAAAPKLAKPNAMQKPKPAPAPPAPTDPPGNS